MENPNKCNFCSDEIINGKHFCKGLNMFVDNNPTEELEQFSIQPETEKISIKEETKEVIETPTAEPVESKVAKTIKKIIKSKKTK